MGMELLLTLVGTCEKDEDVEKIQQAELVDNEQIFDSELVAANFVTALEDWKTKILNQHQTNTQDEKKNRAMMAMTKTLLLKKIIKLHSHNTRTSDAQLW